MSSTMVEMMSAHSVNHGMYTSAQTESHLPGTLRAKGGSSLSPEAGAA